MILSVVLSVFAILELAALVLLELHHRKVQLALIDRIVELAGMQPINQPLQDALREEAAVPLNPPSEYRPPRKILMPTFPDPGVVSAMRQMQRPTTDE